MTKQGTQATNHRLASIEDLDALLAKHSLAPTIVRLGGTDYQIRTDLTANDAAQFLDLTRSGYNAQALTILVGTKAERDALQKAVVSAKAGDSDVDLPAGNQAVKLDEFLETLPRVHVAIVSGRIMRASKALAQNSKTEAEIYAEYGMDLPGESEDAEQGESSAS